MRKRRLIALWALLVLGLAALGAVLSVASPFSLAATQTAHTQRAAAIAGTRQGADFTQTQNAVNAANWPQENSNWCGIATVAAIAQFRGHAVSQVDVVNYLNSPAAASPWGTPTSNGVGPGFAADIARDFGTDPRSLAAGISAEGQGSYHQYVGLASAYDATAELAADIVRTHEPISVITQHGLHSMLVSAVWSTGDPIADPSSITALDVWDPGVGARNGVQAAQYVQVPINTWLTADAYWGSPYAGNGSASAPWDPDPAVGPYTFTSTHLWIGHYVYIRPDAAGDPTTGVSVDWPVTRSGALIPGFGGETPSGYASAKVAITPTSESKITLADTSIAAPGFWSKATNAPVPASYTPISAIAWAGTDPTHRVNVMLSADGLHYDHKVTLNETTFTTPSVLVVNNNNANVVVVAWGGTDPNHSLNILYDVYGITGSPKKRTFVDTSFYAPGLAAFNGQIWLTWAGTDPGRSLNVMATGAQGQVSGAKAILYRDHSATPPTLIPDSAAGSLVLTWRNAWGAPYIGVEQSPDGANWTNVTGQGSYVTVAQPAIIGLNPIPANMTRYYQLWAGTDPVQRFLLAGGAAPNAATTMTALDEAAVGGPQLGYAGQAGHVLVAWTGTDTAHHLNVSNVSV